MNTTQKDEYTLPKLSPSKKHIKLNKSLLKSLRQRNKQKNMLQSEVDSQDSYYTKKSNEKGQHWWKKFDRRFFKQITQINLQKILSKLKPQNLIKSFQSPSERLGSYLNLVIGSEIPEVFQNNYIRVLHSYDDPQQASKKKCIMGIYKVDEEQAEQAIIQKKVTSVQMYPLYSGKKLEEAFKKKQTETTYYNPNIIECVVTTDCQQLIEKCLHYQIVEKKQLDQISKQILYWQKQLDIQTFKNEKSLQVLFQKLSSQKNNQKWTKAYLKSVITGYNFMLPYNQQPSFTVGKTLFQLQQQQISRINKYFFWANTLKYIQYGHADKNIEIMEAIFNQTKRKQALNLQKKNSQQQKFQNLFQTDCKVCFCTENQQKNKVIYCDKCDTSFHQGCYGVKAIDKQDPFYCDVCQYLMQFQSKNKNQHQLKKICCQICFKFSFPLKQIQGHFYHIACLMMFNFGQIKDYQISFREEVTHKFIQQIVMDNQIIHEGCDFCVKSGSKNLGMRIKCMIQGCKKSSHSICAYINGCMFDITKSGTNLSVGYVCCQHVLDRQKVTQSYLRRFFCNYKGTSKLSEEEFKLKYQIEQEEREQMLQQEKKQKQQFISKQLNGKFCTTYINPFKILKRTQHINKRIKSKNQNNKWDTENISENKMYNQIEEIDRNENNDLQDKMSCQENNLADYINQSEQAVEDQIKDTFLIIYNARQKKKDYNKYKIKKQKQEKQKERTKNVNCTSNTSIEKQKPGKCLKTLLLLYQQSKKNNLVNSLLQNQPNKLAKQDTNANSSNSQSGQILNSINPQNQITKPKKISSKKYQDDQYIPETKGKR